VALPFVGHLGGEADHVAAVAGEPGAVEGGLGEAALAEMEGLFAGEEAVAEDAAGAPEDDAADVFGGVADEHFLDVRGVVELELAEAVEGAEAADVAEAAEVLAEEVRRIDGEDGAVQEAFEEGWAGREGSDAGFGWKLYFIESLHSWMDAVPAAKAPEAVERV
jgi:hypothetical protein